jgi:hypothetical protein
MPSALAPSRPLSGAELTFSGRPREDCPREAQASMKSGPAEWCIIDLHQLSDLPLQRFAALYHCGKHTSVTRLGTAAYEAVKMSAR